MRKVRTIIRLKSGYRTDASKTRDDGVACIAASIANQIELLIGCRGRPLPLRQAYLSMVSVDSLLMLVVANIANEEVCGLEYAQ